MRDERIRGQREHLVEQEQRDQVARERDAHGRRQRDGEHDVEAGLVPLLVAPHVADRVQRIDDPQARGEGREQHPEGLDAERQLDAGQQFRDRDTRPLSRHHRGQQSPHGGREPAGRHERHCLAKVCAEPPRQGDTDGAGQRQHQRDQDGGLRAHGR